MQIQHVEMNITANIQDLFFFLNLSSDNSCNTKFHMFSLQQVVGLALACFSCPKKDKMCKSCIFETISAKHSSMYATLEEKAGEWKGNDESTTESNLEIDALCVFTKTTIQEENTPTKWREEQWGLRSLGRSWGTVKLAQAASTSSKHPAHLAGEEYIYQQFTVLADESLPSSTTCPH